ncbi:H(+)/Cl(-) exchange transporter ClcA [Euphorbia peplus]|nr:H(+)/Cl(-) exchange transporter ClcA [Euphorbia peplus]
METTILHFHSPIYSIPIHSPSSSSSSIHFLKSRNPNSDNNFSFPHPPNPKIRTRRLKNGAQSLTKPQSQQQTADNNNNDNDDEPSTSGGDYGIIISSCLVGVLTGIAVVIFNNGVHEIRDTFWDGIPYRGASWLREEPIDSIWVRVVLVPACGGLIVSILNSVSDALDYDNRGTNPFAGALRPFLKAVAASFTLGTGNSLGPEGPSVEIGSSIAKGIGSFNVFSRNSQTKLSLLAAGSAAGIASGFNAAVAGCFFAVESVLWPSSADSSASLTNTTSMVILSAVIASVVSEVGLGSEPAFKVPEYDFRSAGELPLYLLLGILCGLVSLALSKCTSFLLLAVNNLHINNVDILLESRPFVKGLSGDLLFQLVGVKIVTTSLCRACGLVGGYYAPSLFIGAATGMAYGKLISFAVANSYPLVQLSILEVASPQAYGLVGMAATLAGVCQVPLTAVLLLFELTQDYRIVLPLLGAVGMSSWITSGQSTRGVKETRNKGNARLDRPGISSSTAQGQSSGSELTEEASYGSNLCEVESSLCLDDDSSTENEVIKRRIFVSEAMRTRYVTVLLSTLLADAVSLMLAEKQSCAVIVDDHNVLVGLLTLRDIEVFSTTAKVKAGRCEELLVSEVCSLDGEKCRVAWTAKPSMDLFSVQLIMDRYGVSQVPVVSEHIENHTKQPVGLLDRDCIDITCRALATRESIT